MPDKTDVVVIGGGMVGAVFALALHRLLPDLHITVIEKFQPTIDNNFNPSFDARSTALSYATVQLLSQIALSQSVIEQSCAIEQIHVSERKLPARVLLTAEQEKVSALGYVIENRRLGQTLWQAMQACQQITLLAPAQVSAMACTASGMQLSGQLGDQDLQLEATLTVLADGGRSGLSEAVGISHQLHDYQSQAIIANVHMQQPHNGIAFERFTETGPLALLPLSGGDWGRYRSALIWSLPKAEAKQILQQDKTATMHQLQQQFGQRLGAIEQLGELQSYPLSLRTSDEQVRPGLVLLGNVAHSLHPVAGQGFNLAIRDCFVLANCLQQNIAQGGKLHDFAPLQRYQQLQDDDQQLTTAFSHWLPQLFNEPAPANLRQLGLAAMQLSSDGKHLMAGLGMGTLGSARRWTAS